MILNGNWRAIGMNRKEQYVGAESDWRYCRKSFCPLQCDEVEAEELPNCPYSYVYLCSRKIKRINIGKLWKSAEVPPDHCAIVPPLKTQTELRGAKRNRNNLA
ncbi:hypothetical protein F2P81_008871 [Scophthalmus maximus]|uniref:Uncharacterized protein n=1 Tax=Scophthalmus maximus TaxID=52904 RepID=A0A6A4SXR4_SCOMX|nr:hypothetical protein F2P81_008871 [Scophthalmus maximus]